MYNTDPWITPDPMDIFGRTPQPVTQRDEPYTITYLPPSQRIKAIHYDEQGRIKSVEFYE